MNARSTVPAVILDGLLIIVFATFGRRSHDLHLTLMGVLETAWPFLVGLVVSWGIIAGWRHPVDPIRTGVPLWIGTVAIGMTLRVLTTEADFVWPFFFVAMGTVGLMLVGWRALSALLRRGARTPQR